MEEYKVRMIEEKNLLDAKIDRLRDFIKGDVFKGLSSQAQCLLDNQLLAMWEYSRILEMRIDLK